jgi:hypothetical protein
MGDCRPIDLADGTWRGECPWCPLVFDADTREAVLEIVADHLLEDHVGV